MPFACESKKLFGSLMDTMQHHSIDVIFLNSRDASLAFRGLCSVIEMGTHSAHKTVQMARRYARPTAEQFERAAARRVAAASVGDGSRDGMTETEETSTR